MKKQILVKIPGREVLAVQKMHCETPMTVGDLKTAIFLKRNIKSANFFLQHGTKILGDNSQSIETFGIQDGSTVFLTYRTRGGCFIVSLSILWVIALLILISPMSCGGSLLVVPFLLPFLFILPCFLL
mmetsp:Transcript_4108/g.5707  ORF Transcript_4108/g.5707 Transcript_4108/m.5707 type:complete len:128 (-) Transcript_4108:254-637(-)